MPYRDWRFRFDDIIEAINKISRYTNGMDFHTWCKDEITIDAVIRNMKIIGEAASHIPDEVQDQFENVPWRMMKDLPLLKKRLSK